MLEYLVCCFHKLSAFFIQYFLFGLLSIVISFSVSGFFVIDWVEAKDNARLVFGLGIIVLIITYIILIIIIILRARNTLNYKYYKFGLGLGYYALIISFIGLVLSIIAFLWGAYQFFSIRYIEKGELVITVLAMVLLVAGFVVSIPAWICLVIRLRIKTNDRFVGGAALYEENPSSTPREKEKEVKINYGTRQISLS